MSQQITNQSEPGRLGTLSRPRASFTSSGGGHCFGASPQHRCRWAERHCSGQEGGRANWPTQTGFLSQSFVQLLSIKVRRCGSSSHPAALALLGGKEWGTGPGNWKERGLARLNDACLSEGALHDVMYIRQSQTHEFKLQDDIPMQGTQPQTCQFPKLANQSNTKITKFPVESPCQKCADKGPQCPHSSQA